ncbi:hypothetical protein ACLB2K_067044 [Fragaria x ananassa]
MFAWSEWNLSIWASKESKKVADIVEDQSFWTGAEMVSKATMSLVRALELIFEADKPLVGHIYETMDQVKERIKEELKNKRSQYMLFWQVIDDICDNILHNPLHGAGYYLNPSLKYSSDFYCDDEVYLGLMCCIAQMVRAPSIQDVINTQLKEYIRAEGSFKEDMDKSWISLPRYHRKYAEGVWDFMQYAQGNADGSGMFYCPCKMCKCRSDMHRFPLGTFDETGSTSNDPTTTFINDMFPHDSGVCPERQHIPQAPMQAVPRVYPTCTVNGVKFVSEERDSRRRTQNSGVMAKGHGLDYYGVLHSVVELVYAEGMKVHLFKCRWFDTGAQSMKMDQYGNLSVNTATSAYEDDPFVFATSVKQVFYLDDLARGDAWKIANIVHPRKIYRAATLGVTIPGPEADAYQEPNAVGIHDVATVRQNNVKHGRVLRIRDEDSTFIDVDPNEETDDDSDDELRHRLPDINSDTEEDSSDDSDYEP